MKLLLVDDHHTTRSILKNILREIHPFKIAEAHDGAMALEVLKQCFNTKGEEVELIICDWYMPNVTGLDFLKAVRSSNEFKALPFVMVTAEAEMSMFMTAVKTGANDYILKPFSKQKIQEKLAKYIKN